MIPGIEISAVNRSLQYKDVSMSIVKAEEEGNLVIIPKENYELLKGLLFIYLFVYFFIYNAECLYMILTAFTDTFLQIQPLHENRCSYSMYILIRSETEKHISKLFNIDNYSARFCKKKRKRNLQTKVSTFT